MTVDELAGKYAWVNEIEAWTVSVMRPRSVAEVLRIYGGDEAEPVGEVAFADADRHRVGDEPLVQVLEFDECTVTLENNGYSGALPEIARRCSAGGGWFYSVYWNVNAAGNVTQAVDGEVVAYFDSLFPVTPQPQGDGDRRPEWAIGPPVATGMRWQVCMAQLERQTGVAVQPDWLTRPYPTYELPEPYELYHDVDGAELI